MENIIQRARKAVSSHPSNPGSWAVFYDMKVGFGVKFYASPEDRDAAMIGQLVAYEGGFAPFTPGKTIDLPTPLDFDHPVNVTFGPTMYGYVTETVRELEAYETDGTQLSQLRLKMQKAGFPVNDVGYGLNVGQRKNGDYVAFDFDPNYGMMGLFS